MRKDVKRTVASFFAVLILMSGAYDASAFPDLGDEDYADAVGYVSEVGIMVGDENGLLEGVSTSKGSPMSRADVAVILYNCLG